MVDLSGFQKLCDVHDVDMNLEACGSVIFAPFFLCLGHINICLEVVMLLVALFMLIIDKFVFERNASTVANMAIGCQ